MAEVPQWKAVLGLEYGAETGVREGEGEGGERERERVVRRNSY